MLRFTAVDELFGTHRHLDGSVQARFARHCRDALPTTRRAHRPVERRARSADELQRRLASGSAGCPAQEAPALGEFFFSQRPPESLKYQAWLPTWGPVTCCFSVSGWRDLNPRPLRPERAYSVTASINECRHVLVDRRAGCSGGIPCRSVADFLLTLVSAAPRSSFDEREPLVFWPRTVCRRPGLVVDGWRGPGAGPGVAPDKHVKSGGAPAL